MMRCFDKVVLGKNGGRFVLQNDEIWRQSGTGQKVAVVLCLRITRLLPKSGNGKNRRAYGLRNDEILRQSGAEKKGRVFCTSKG
jgi:hypothetical protein